jgi:hypothetical protein
VPPLSKRAHKPRRTTVTGGLRAPRGQALPAGRYTAILFVGNTALRRITARIG